MPRFYHSSAGSKIVGLDNDQHHNVQEARQEQNVTYRRVAQYWLPYYLLGFANASTGTSRNKRRS
ncbi:MAG: hypothetical protein R2867_00160 [Caldilineaceae bacterium]